MQITGHFNAVTSSEEKMVEGEKKRFRVIQTVNEKR